MKKKYKFNLFFRKKIGKIVENDISQTIKYIDEDESATDCSRFIRNRHQEVYEEGKADGIARGMENEKAGMLPLDYMKMVFLWK